MAAAQVYPHNGRHHPQHQQPYGGPAQMQQQQQQGSTTLHYSRDAASTSQATSLLPVSHVGGALTGVRRNIHPDSSDDDDDDDDTTAQGFGSWMREAESADVDDAAANAAVRHWDAKRHRSGGNPRALLGEEAAPPPWRLRSRLKTFSAALVVCLNLGVDPPDVVKSQPCAKLECWVDPGGLPSQKAMEAICRNLQQQFEVLSPKVRYKQYADPSVEDTKKFCVSLRKSAKEERVLMYYNGHGVPKPTASGEIWVFNKGFTQYIPVSLYDLQSWLGRPCIFVWDCSAAGNIITNFNRWAERRDAEGASEKANGGGRGGDDAHSTAPDGNFTPFLDCIHLAACQADQVLPMTPDLPADLFTCCLTSPIEIALRFFILQDPLRSNVPEDDARAKVTVDLVLKIPGDLKDRRTPLGELNWIFTAVTDTIAWLVFPRDIFKRLFRQDLLVAALFRNFLLAERIMRAYHCTPMSHPVLPATHNHPLWQSWDLAVDACLAQLPDLLAAEQHQKEYPGAPPIYVYQPSKFFADHLRAFEVWLQQGGSTSSHLALQPHFPGAGRKPPDQLPIVLQVLLSQTHRLRALILLSKFVDLGPWAVQMALSIGIFPYVQKLLQSPAVDLKPVLLFIWSRILAVDRSCQVDLLKDNGFAYFARILAPSLPNAPAMVIPNAGEHRAMCAFILSAVCRGHRQGQMACMSQNVFQACLNRLHDSDWLLKQWSLLCIAQLWSDGNDAVKLMAIKEGYQDQLLVMLQDESAEVRAASMYALGTFLGASGMSAEDVDVKGGGGTGAQLSITERQQFKLEAGVSHACVLQSKSDASPLVRKELIVALSCIVREWRGWFVVAAWCYHEQEHRKLDLGGDESADRPNGDDLVEKALRKWGNRSDRSDAEHEENITILAVFKFMFASLLDLSVDPHPEVATLACTVVDYITALLLDSAFSRVKGSTFSVQPFMEKTQPTRTKVAPAGLHSPSLAQLSSAASQDSGIFPSQPTTSRPDAPATGGTSRIANTLKRNNSFANALKNLASMTGYATPAPQEERPRTPPAPVNGTLTRNNSANGTQLQGPAYVPPYPLARSDTDTSQGGFPQSRGMERTTSIGNILSGTSQLTITSRTAQHADKPRSSSASSADVIEALTQEDMNRLVIRRNAATQAGGSANGLSSNEGKPRASDLGLGIVAKEVKDDVLPLRSDLYDYSLEYFREPQMKTLDAYDPGSEVYNKELWLRQRQQSLMEDSRSRDEAAANTKWTTTVRTLSNDAWPALVAFHAFESDLAVADEGDNICIWDWKTGKRASRFSNCGGRGASTSSMHFVNETAITPLLLTASTDGNVRIWRDYASPAPSLAAAFRAVDEPAPVSRPAGVVTAWSQRSGHLLVGGDMRTIKLWDANREALGRNFFTQAGSNVTSLASGDYVEGENIFVAGFGDGVVRVFDKRSEEGLVQVMRQHQTWIQNVCLRYDGGRELITGSMNGDVKIFDLRSPGTPLSSTACAPNGLSAFTVHPHARLFATLSAPASSQASAHQDALHQARNGFAPTRQGSHAAGPSVQAGLVQKLSMWRIEDDFGTNSSSTGTYDDLTRGEAPTRLSELNLRGNTGQTDPTSASQGGSHRHQRILGAGMNALTFHPTELLLAVGGFDRAYGSLRLVTHDLKKDFDRDPIVERYSNGV